MRPILGVDIEELDRFESPSENLINRILSEDEKKVYETFQSEKRKKEFLGGRFAAKEAYKKAYQHFDEPVSFKDVSILNTKDGSPLLSSKYRSEDTVLVSISHSDHYVVAVVSGETT